MKLSRLFKDTDIPAVWVIFQNTFHLFIRLSISNRLTTDMTAAPLVHHTADKRFKLFDNTFILRAKYEEIYEKDYHDHTTHKDRKIQKKQYEAREKKRKETGH